MGVTGSGRQVEVAVEDPQTSVRFCPKVFDFIRLRGDGARRMVSQTCLEGQRLPLLSVQEG